MAWIQMVPEDKATGPLKEGYNPRGRTIAASEIVKVFSLRPELLDVRLRFSRCTTFGGSSLGRYREELIAVSISAACKCRY